MIKDFLLLSSAIAPFFLVFPEASGLYLAGIFLEKSLKDIHTQSNNQLNIATYLFRTIYSVLGITSATFVETLFNINIVTSVISILLGMAISLAADLIDSLCIKKPTIPKAQTGSNFSLS